MSSYNRIANAGNRFQGDRKKVLCVCSAGLLRSPTLAWILSNEPFGYNTRSVGTSSEYALIPLEDVHLEWADVVVFVDEDNYRMARMNFGDMIDNMPHHVLSIPDQYPFRDETLVKIATEELMKVFPVEKKE